jgi:hypothetical protein
MTQRSSEVRVAIIGGGIAGLTAALCLSQRGYRVTVYEEKPYLGGQLGAHEYKGTYHEHGFHMFLNWYNNFWRMVEEDLGLRREDYFEARTSVKYLRKGEFPNFTQLTSDGLPVSQWSNLLSGVEPMPDMFLWYYSLLDLISQPSREGELLGRNSVNGFMASRFYATNRSASLHQEILTKAFAVPSYMTSAPSYKNFIKFGFRHPHPLLWILKGNVYEKLICPIESKLISYGCNILKGVSVTQIILSHEGNVASLQLQNTQFDASKDTIQLVPRTLQEHPIDNLILAIPSKPLGKLLETGEKGRRIVDKLPDLAEVRGLETASIASLNVHFTRKLNGIPKEHVILRGSDYAISFIDNSQAWADAPDMSKGSVLSVASSDFYSLASVDPYDDAYGILSQLNEYLSVFNLGSGWGDPNSDVDWDRSYFQPNAGDGIFINETGSEQWRPVTTYEAIPNLFFAGDFCRNFIEVITVEAAVVSGLEAARALHSRRPLGAPIQIIEPDVYPEGGIVGMKLLLAPYALVAKWWSMADDLVSQVAGQGHWEDPISAMPGMYWAPYAVAAQWMESAWNMYRDIWFGGKNR